MSDRSVEDTDVVSRVAMRVRNLRKEQKTPRRVISEKSGVSPRYLAQLEAGEGNISIVLLQRIASTLGTSIEALVAEDPPLDPKSRRVATLYRNAPTDVQARVMAQLNRMSSMSPRAGRICLVGLRGAGKSTLGQLASEALGLSFVELNRVIEDHTGMPLSEVMAFYGQEGYRRLETQTLERITRKHERMVLAVAGGIVGSEKTYDSVLNGFHTIWVHASPGEYMERVRAQGDLRPMAGNPTAMAQLRSLLDERIEKYRMAEAHLDTSNRSVTTSLNDLLGVITAHGFLDQ